MRLTRLVRLMRLMRLGRPVRATLRNCILRAASSPLSWSPDAHAGRTGGRSVPRGNPWLRCALGHVPIPFQTRWPPAGFNRLLKLAAAMVLCCGLLMWQQAPRTLAAFTVILGSVQALVWLVAAVCLLAPRFRAALRRWGQPRSARRSRQVARRALPRGAERLGGGAALDWRPFEWALLGVLLMSLLVPV